MPQVIEKILVLWNIDTDESTKLVGWKSEVLENEYQRKDDGVISDILSFVKKARFQPAFLRVSY